MSLDNQLFYKKALQKYGTTAKGLNWKDERSQRVRFEVITKLLKDELSTCKIVDAGCGFGDLYFFLEEVGQKPKNYIGIDSIDKSVKISKKRLKKYSNCDLYCKNILTDELPSADWYIASGSLNILNSFDTWLFLERMLLHSKIGVVFNILNGEKQSENFNYQTKKSIISFMAKKGFSVEFVEGYLPDDMTVEVRK